MIEQDLVVAYLPRLAMRPPTRFPLSSPQKLPSGQPWLSHHRTQKLTPCPPPGEWIPPGGLGGGAPRGRDQAVLCPPLMLVLKLRSS
jgi:hypothetical protein